MSPSERPVAVVGAGAAGLLAALTAARTGAPVVLLERTSDGGRKILISGGGRCNILPSVPHPERFVTDSSAHVLKRILRSWPLAEQRAFFEHELAMRLVVEDETGKLFPESNRARDVRDRLAQRVREAGARVWLDATVRGVSPPTEGTPRWRIDLDDAPTLEAAAVVLATGGLSVPATGSDGIGIGIARGLGHEIRPTYPALTPLLADPPVHADLAGISLTVTIQAPGARPRFSTTDGFLFTHRGYSGPSVLDASHLAVRSGLAGRERQPLTVRWTARDFDAWERDLTEGRGAVGTLVGRALPARLADRILHEAGVAPTESLARLAREPRRRLAALLADYPLPWTGDEGYRKAEVTGGGVALEEVDPRTLESRRHPGLFFCGEILDAFGPIGGHNFQWAWATGRAAGAAAAASLSASDPR
ncbi:MAG: aminoacetone oxidase family FAD-binding enzyme [Gemmatimonadetes bacterium]|nr:aminoacetone oxidase family FAD-binding enzyme [Gemmatimonadota bacterium]